jgi:hypothetical protein
VPRPAPIAQAAGVLAPTAVAPEAELREPTTAARAQALAPVRPVRLVRLAQVPTPRRAPVAPVAEVAEVAEVARARRAQVRQPGAPPALLLALAPMGRPLEAAGPVPARMGWLVQVPQLALEVRLLGAALAARGLMQLAGAEPEPGLAGAEPEPGLAAAEPEPGLAAAGAEPGLVVERQLVQVARLAPKEVAAVPAPVVAVPVSLARRRCRRWRLHHSVQTN